MPISLEDLEELCTRYPDLEGWLHAFAREDRGFASTQEFVEINGSDPERIYELFEELEGMGLGTHQPDWRPIFPGMAEGRFHWKVKTNTLRKAWLGNDRALEEINRSIEPPEDDPEEDEEESEEEDLDAEDNDSEDDSETDPDEADEDEDSSEDGVETGWRQYDFPLRPDRVLSFELPADLSAHEATRLSLFVKSLPLGGDLPEAWEDEEEVPSHGFDFPLRPDLTVPMEIPADITASEADRLGRLFTSLPID